MSDDLIIQVCENFRKEVEVIVEHEKWNHLRFTFLPARCGIPQIRESEVVLEEANETVVIGGGCIHDLSQKQITDGQSFIYEDNCFYILTDKVIVDKYISENSYLLSPGWLCRWRTYIEQIWKFDQKTARQFFSETTAKLVLLDTGVDSESQRHLNELSEYLNIPSEICLVGLDHLTLYIQKIYSEWKEKKYQREILKLRKDSSDRTVALDLLGRLTQYHTEEDVINQVMELFSILFAAEELYYLPIHETGPGKLHYCFANNYNQDEIIQEMLNLPKGFKRSENGFHLTVYKEKKQVGIIQVKKVLFPEYINSYLNLAVEVSAVFGLAIENVRTYQKLQLAKEEQILITKVLQLFINAEEGRDEILEILQLIKDFAGTEAVAIRLKSGDDYPYVHTIGFPAEFVSAETNLCSSGDNDMMRDDNGVPRLACLCGRVIRGDSDAELSFFSKYGSFWTNHSADTVKKLPDHFTINLRGRCVLLGYQSIALIPLRGDKETFGLLQLNDHKEGIFSEKKIEFLEKVGNSISIALQRKENVKILAVAKKKAEDANHSKSDFLANMSHEIRTPMNAILGFGDILLESENDPQKKHFLEAIRISGRALISIINDVLDISKIESGKLELQYTPTSIHSMFRDLEILFSQKVKEKGLKLELIINDSFPKSLLLDDVHLKQVFINLLSNALKFTHTGYIKISAQSSSYEPLSENNVNLQFSVSDSGIGIPQDQLGEVFKNFVQTAGQKKRDYGGTGLGLTICKKIIEMMNGSITLESEPGVGTVFTISIPEIEIISEQQLALSDSSELSAAIDFKPATILIADDINYNRELLCNYLQQWNFTIYYAKDGKETLDTALKIHPDIILTDLKMPVMSGYEVSQKLKENPQTNDIQIIAVSASALKQEEDKIMKFCDAYLRKPVSKMELINKLKEFLPHDIQTEDNREASEPEVVMLESQDSPLHEELDTLTEEIRKELYYLISTGQISKLQRYTQQLKSDYPNTALYIQKQAETFRIDMIRKILDFI